MGPGGERPRGPVCAEFHYLISSLIWYNSSRIVAGLGPRGMLDDYFRQYGLIAIFVAIAIIVPTSMLTISWLASRIGLRPQNSTAVKRDTYECGMEAIGGKWGQFNFRYYMYAVLFVVFDVEVVFLYPWATKFLSLELFALIEMFVFVGILLVAWAYAWRKGDLEWA